ncbi:oligopeptide transporter 4, partial [Quercus suber]
MDTLNIQTPYPNTNSNSTKPTDPEKDISTIDEDEELCPIEEVRLTVANTDDPTLPIWTFRMWFLGLISCALLSFLNQFFAYRTEPLVITQITVQVATLPIGRFMASVLPKTKFHIPGFGSRSFSLNPGPFNMKEHVLISIFANAGSAFGSGAAYAVGIVNIIKAFYHRNISFFAAWLLIITTQVLGYGWAGLLRKYVVEPAHMWWPATLVQVSLFRALHENEKRRMSRAKFFLIALICSFSWYLVPGYLFTTLTSISWVCWVFSKSVTAQQIGSGMRGLGLGALTLDWSAVASFLFSPLVSPFFSIVNVFAGYFLVVYIAIPIGYWGLDLYGARRFPIFSSHLFTAQGQAYNISAIVNDKFELNISNYEEQGRIHLSMFFSLTYGFGFATIASTLTHVALFYGREIYERYRASYKGKEDIHTKLMKRYKDIPSWWFYLLLVVTMAVSLALCIFLNNQVQMPWWGLLFAAAMAFTFTLPISIITATTNQTPGLNIITEYAMGLIYPGRPIANVCFKTFGYMSMAQAVSFLSDFKLGHYMKIPPRSMFLVQ